MRKLVQVYPSDLTVLALSNRTSGPQGKVARWMIDAFETMCRIEIEALPPEVVAHVERALDVVPDVVLDIWRADAARQGFVDQLLVNADVDALRWTAGTRCALVDRILTSRRLALETPR